MGPTGEPLSGEEAMVLLKRVDAISQLRARGYQVEEFIIASAPQTTQVQPRGEVLDTSYLHDPKYCYNSIHNVVGSSASLILIISGPVASALALAMVVGVLIIGIAVLIKCVRNRRK